MIQINVRLPLAQMELDPLEVMAFCGLSQVYVVECIIRSTGMSV